MSNAKVTWFEIGTDDPEGTERFYGGVFGWTFAKDGNAPMDYRLISPAEGQPPIGGLWASGAPDSPYAIFYVQVDDVAAACRRAEELGGKVLVAPVENPDGLIFAQVLDTNGARFAIWNGVA